MTSDKKDYICKICKDSPFSNGWRRKYKWKTEKGFNNHKCYSDVEKRNNELAEKRKEDIEKRIQGSKYKVGDSVIFCKYHITKPIREWRGNRLVKVRYEEERKYFAGRGTIKEITLYGYIIAEHSIEIFDSDIYENLEEATKKAAELQKSYNEACDFASFCR